MFSTRLNNRCLGKYRSSKRNLTLVVNGSNPNKELVLATVVEVLVVLREMVVHEEEVLVQVQVHACTDPTVPNALIQEDHLAKRS